jgi:hypothetical protein
LASRIESSKAQPKMALCEVLNGCGPHPTYELRDPDRPFPM